MILINRLLQTEIGWSKDMQQRLEYALNWSSIENVMFYPNPKIKRDCSAVDLARYGIKSAKWLKRYDKQHPNTIEKIIFLDSMQLPRVQLEELGRNVDYEVYLRITPDYSEYGRHTQSYFEEQFSFRKILAHSLYTALSYNSTKWRAVGNPLLPFNPRPKQDFILWSGHEITNKIKGMNDFLDVARKHSDKLFYMCLSGNKRPNVLLPTNVQVFLNIDSEHYKDYLKSAKFILSTAQLETFGNSVMDGITYGCIPIVRDSGAFIDLIPSAFRYKKLSDIVFDEDVEQEKLKTIVEPYTADKVLRRLINEED